MYKEPLKFKAFKDHCIFECQCGRMVKVKFWDVGTCPCGYMYGLVGESVMKDIEKIVKVEVKEYV